MHYVDAYNETPRHDQRHQQAAKSLACAFLYKMNLEAQLIEILNHPVPKTSTGESSNIPTAPEDLAALSDRALVFGAKVSTMP